MDTLATIQLTREQMRALVLDPSNSMRVPLNEDQVIDMVKPIFDTLYKAVVERARHTAKIPIPELMSMFDVAFSVYDKNKSSVSVESPTVSVQSSSTAEIDALRKDLTEATRRIGELERVKAAATSSSSSPCDLGANSADSKRVIDLDAQVRGLAATVEKHDRQAIAEAERVDRMVECINAHTKQVNYHDTVLGDHRRALLLLDDATGQVTWDGVRRKWVPYKRAY
jgi:hypothetical protein